MMKKLLTGAALMALASVQQVSAQNSAVINFTGTLNPGGYTGVSAFDPFSPGTLPNNLVNGVPPLGSPSTASPDWLSVDGQIVISNFMGDGTYQIGGSGGQAGGIYIMSPLLNRIETRSLDTIGLLTAASQALPGVQLGDPNRAYRAGDDVFIPDFSPNGVATVTIAGSSVTIDYGLDFSMLGDENARFLRAIPGAPGDPGAPVPIPPGFVPTGLSIALDSVNAKFSFFGISGTNMATVSSAAKGSAAGLATPFGGYTAIENIGNNGGVINDTVIPTTLQLLQNEFAANNISEGGVPISLPAELDPFFGPSGDIFFFNLTGDEALEFDVQATVVPVPAAAFLLAPALGMMLPFRRRFAKTAS